MSMHHFYEYNDEYQRGFFYVGKESFEIKLPDKEDCKAISKMLDLQYHRGGDAMHLTMERALQGVLIQTKKHVEAS